MLVLCLVGSFLRADETLAQATQDDLLGDYAVTIAAEDVPPELIGGASLIGRWHISLDGNVYRLARQDVGPLLRGVLGVAGDRVTLQDETGVVACEPGPEGDAATYEWSVTDGRLLLTAIEEPCDRRRLLLTTRTLAAFAPCPTQAAMSAESFDRGSGATSAAAIVPDASTPESAIDTLLKQMSDCWATRQPERFLPMLSQEHRAAQSPDDEDAERRYILNMGAPVVWELYGEIELSGDARAEAMVRQTLGDTVDTVRYAFVFEDGSWRWDGAADGP
jgi:hypothetical protein